DRLDRAVVMPHDRFQCRDLRRRHLDGRGYHKPAYPFTAWRGSQRAGILESKMIRWQHSQRIEGHAWRLKLCTSLLRQIGENRRKRGILSPFFDEHTNHCKMIVRICMYQMQLGSILLTAHGMLAWR